MTVYAVTYQGKILSLWQHEIDAVRRADLLERQTGNTYTVSAVVAQ